MAATLVATFTLIGCIRGSLYGDMWNLVRSVRVGETLNCELEVTSRGRFKEIWHKVGHILRVISCICTARYFLIRHGNVISPL